MECLQAKLNFVVVLRSKGKLEAALGHGEEARDFFKKAISGVAPPASLFGNYIRWELRHKNIPAASEASLKAIGLYKNNPEIAVLRAKSLILGPEYSIADVAQLLVEVQRATTGYHQMEAYFWYGIAKWENSEFSEAMDQFHHCREIALSLARGDVKYIRYISGMNKDSPKLYNGSVVETGPRNAWIICNPSGIKVFINRKGLINLSSNITIKIGFNRLGPVAISDDESEEFTYDNVV